MACCDFADVCTVEVPREVESYDSPQGCAVTLPSERLYFLFPKQPSSPLSQVMASFKVLVIGSGMVARPCVEYLSRSSKNDISVGRSPGSI